jgi:alpha-tubulin suppressor-like RCC1 family protein
MALIDIQKIRPHWKATFVANVAYMVNDVIRYDVPFTHQSNIYICKTNSIGNLPSDTAFFDLLVSNIIPLESKGEIFYYNEAGDANSNNNPSNVLMAAPDGSAHVESVKKRDTRDYFLFSEGEGEVPTWDIPKTNSRHTVAKLCMRLGGHHHGNGMYVIMDDGTVFHVGGHHNYAGGGIPGAGATYKAFIRPAFSANFPGALDVISTGRVNFCIDKELKLWHWGRQDAYHSARETTGNERVWMPVRVGTGTSDSDFKKKYISKFVTGAAQDAHSSNESHDYTDGALMTDGSLYTWGGNDEGAVGNGTTGTYQNTPWQISGIWTNIWGAGGGQRNRMYGTKLQNGVNYCYAWGNNYRGYLGVGDTSNRQSPTLVSGDGLIDGEEVLNIWSHSAEASPDTSATFFQTKDSRKMYWCGDDVHGMSGQGTNLGHSAVQWIPKVIPTLGNTTDGPYVVQFRSSQTYYGPVCALMSDGTIRVWGFCQNGVGNNVDNQGAITTPYDPGLHSPHLYDSPIVKVDVCGAYYSTWTNAEHSVQLYALRADGTLWSSGQNYFGMLGIGEQSYGDSGYVHDGQVGSHQGTPQRERADQWVPWTRYWNAYRSGDIAVGGSGSHTFDQEGWRGHGSMMPIRQGFHRFTDFQLYSGQQGANNSAYYPAVLMVDELGILNGYGSGSHNPHSHETFGGTDILNCPTPINFP